MTNVLLSIILCLLLLWLLISFRRSREEREFRQELRRRHVLGGDDDPKVEELRHHEVHHTFEKGIKGEQAFNSLGVPPSDTLKNFQLLYADTLNTEALNRCQKILSGIKKPDDIVPGFIWTMNSAKLIDASPDNPNLANAILNIINSDDFNLKQKATTIDEALKFFALNTITAIASQLVVSPAVDDAQTKKNSIYQKIWLNGCVSGSLAMVMAQSLTLRQAGLFATQALFNPIGCFAIVAFEQSFTNVYGFEKSLFAQVQKEQHTLGLNRAVIAAELAKLWHLPSSLVFSLNHGLDLLSFKKPYKKLDESEKQRLTLCYLANRIAEEVAYSGLRDISQFHLANKTLPEYHFLQEALENTELGDCFNLLNNANFCDKANQIINKLAGPH